MENEKDLLSGQTPEDDTPTASEETKNVPEESTPQAEPVVFDPAADTDALREEFPTADTASLENPVRYAELRALGLTPKEAYLATGGTHMHRADNRAHLQSTLPRVVGGGDEGIGASELAAARELFVGLSDHEIRKLYKKVTA